MKESAFDSLVSGTQDLEFSFLEKKLQETIGIGSLTDDVLRTLGLSTKEGHYNNAAALMADQNSFSELTSRDSVTASTISLTGRLFREFPSSHSMTSPWRCTGSTTSTRSLTVSGEGLLKPFLKPPSREAMANAIAGRKWNVNAHIRVAMFADRIEIFTPGGLPEGINRDDYMNSMVPLLRNPVLSSVFYRMHYLEQPGTGIRRIQEAYENNRRKPVFDISENAIQAILPVPGTADLTEDQETVYGLMKTGRKISSSSASQDTGFSKSKVTAILKQLAAKGYVQITGNGRGTKYEAAK